MICIRLSCLEQVCLTLIHQGGDRNDPLAYFFITIQFQDYSGFVKFGDFPKIYLGLIFWSFAVSALFHDQMLFFEYVFCWNNELYPCQYLSHLSPKGLEKTCFHFSNNTFPINRVIISLGSYIWGIQFIKILKFDYRPEIW